jgi:SHS2 domain-containing protein
MDDSARGSAAPGEGAGTPETGFREIDYSGDVGIEAWGGTRAGLLENLTRGLFGLMAWSAGDGPVVERRIQVAPGAAADVLVDWLSAVILAAATHGEVYATVRVEHAGEDGAAGVVRGAPFDPARHARRFDVKAATYHDLLVETRDGGHHARVIFDL